MPSTPTFSFHELPSLKSVCHHLGPWLHSPSPPNSIFIHSPSNPLFSAQLVTHFLDQLKLDHQDRLLLPNYVSLDLAEIHNSRNLFETILNQFANWSPYWTAQGQESWNGQLDGLNLVQHSPDSQPVLQWDQDSAIRDDGKGLLAQRKSNSFDGLCDGLRIIANQLSYSDPCTQKKVKLTDAYPRFIVLNEPERLRFWNDPNLIASLTRLAELSGCAIHTIFVSRLPWSKLRPRYGALDPLTLMIPKLPEVDLAKVLCARGPCEERGPTATSAFGPFVNFIVSAFSSQTSGELFELATLVDRIWPEWLSQMDESGLTAEDMAKLILLSRPTIEREQQTYGCPVWHVPAFMAKPGCVEPARAPSDAGGASDADADAGSPGPRHLAAVSVSPAKTRTCQPGAAPFTTPSKPRHYLSIFSPHTSGSRHPFPLTPTAKTKAHVFRGPPPFARQRPQDSLSASLPVLARFIILASYVASFNPPKTDLGMFLTANHQGAQKRRTNRTPRKPQPGQEIKAKVGQQLVGPKAVPIGRLLAILNALTDQEGIEFREIDVHQQIGQLLQSRLLTTPTTQYNTSKTSSSTNAGSLEKLENLKISCGIVDRKVVELLGASVGVCDFRNLVWENWE